METNKMADVARLFGKKLDEEFEVSQCFATWLWLRYSVFITKFQGGD